VLGAIHAGPWAIQEDALALIIRIAERAGEGPEAVEARLGRPLDHTHAVAVRDGVPTIPITGPIFRYANLFTRMSGGANIDALAQDLQASLESPAVRAILLHIDSPGGQVAGTNELAAMIVAARDIKPIWAYIDGVGASAAYWLASAASRIVLDATAAAGSIGVIGTVRTPKDAGESITFVSSQSPRKLPDLATEDGRTQIQQEIDALAEVFVSTVAANRGVPVTTVLADFGGGGVLIGQQAVDAGLADALGSYESTLTALRTHALSRPVGARTRSAALATGVRRMTDVLDPPITPAAADSALLEELAVMKRQLAHERGARITAEAEAFAEREVRASRLLPAESAHYTGLYAQLAQDDAGNPLPTGSRLDMLRASVAARPAHAQVLTTLSAEAVVLPPIGGSAAPDTHAKAVRRAALMNKSVEGRAVLAAEKGGV